MPEPDPLDPAYAILAYTMNRAVIDQMLRAARHFGGDYERLILWGTVAHLNVAHLMPPGSLPSSLLDARGNLPEASQALRPVLLRDLAQITGIPRETARRKLEALAAQGWIRRTRDGWLIEVERTDAELRPFTLDSIRRFLQSARVMQGALDDVADTGRAGPPAPVTAAAPAKARTTGARRG